MNKSFKSVFNKSTGTYVAAGENVKSRGKSSKNKLAMKLASASLAFGASVAMLSPMEASADESVPASGYMADAPDVANAADAADATNAAPDEVVDAPVEDIASPGAGSTGGTRLLGSQMLGATLLGGTVSVVDPNADIAAFDSPYIKVGGRVDGTQTAQITVESPMYRRPLQTPWPTIPTITAKSRWAEPMQAPQCS
jgi:Extended Signal Peptide of Type V secretion system